MSKSEVIRSDVAGWGWPYEGIAARIIDLMRACSHLGAERTHLVYCREEDRWNIWREMVRGGQDVLPVRDFKTLEEAVEWAIETLAEMREAGDDDEQKAA